TLKSTISGERGTISSGQIRAAASPASPASSKCACSKAAALHVCNDDERTVSYSNAARGHGAGHSPAALRAGMVGLADRRGAAIARHQGVLAADAQHWGRACLLAFLALSIQGA